MDLGRCFLIFREKKARVMVEEKRRLVGFGAIHCFGSSKEKKSRYEILVWNLDVGILV